MFVLIDNKKVNLKMTIKTMGDLGLLQKKSLNNLEEMNDYLMGLEFKDVSVLIKFLEATSDLSRNQIIKSLNNTDKLDEVFNKALDFLKTAQLTKPMANKVGAAIEKEMRNALPTMK